MYVFSTPVIRHVFAGFYIWLWSYYFLNINHVFDCFDFSHIFDCIDINIQYKVTSHVFDSINVTLVMYLTTWIFSHVFDWIDILYTISSQYSCIRLNSHVFGCCNFTDRNKFVSSHSCVSIFSHVFDCIEYGSVMYLTVFSFIWSWYKSCIWLFSIDHISHIFDLIKKMWFIQQELLL